MATAQLKKLTSTPLYCNFSGSDGYAASWSLATITNGLTDGYLCYVQVVAALFDSTGGSTSGATGAANYSSLISAYACIKYNSTGPTYDLSSIGTTTIHAGTAGNMIDSFTLVQTGGNLKLKVVQTSNGEPFVCYALLTTINSK